MTGPERARRSRCREYRDGAGYERSDGKTAPAQTVTAALLALSGPRQLAVAGVMVYCHEPAGTLFSVHVSAVIVLEQFAPIVCRTPVDVL